MNLLDFVRRNEFLKKVFPNGLEESVYIGQIVFDVEGRLSVKIHTHQKPAVDVSKWGDSYIFRTVMNWRRPIRASRAW
ncbi:hypothetical protein ACJ8LB_22210, partial [Serratia sp. CY58181]